MLMKYFTTIFFLIIIDVGSFSQKHDYHWVFGNINSKDRPEIGSTDMVFLGDSIDISKTQHSINLFATNASICDKSGNLMFYTNGMFVINMEQDTIENGFGLNPGEVYDFNLDKGYSCPQGAIILPSILEDSLYYLIHMRLLWDIDATVDALFYSKIDMRENGGKGKVMEKNKGILWDDLAYGLVTAVKHANGRDWWIMKAQKYTNGYYRILFTPEGFQEPILQNIGNDYGPNDGRGQAVFSPDGSKYARYDIIHDLQLFDFDRCSGELSNVVHVEINDFADTAWAAGGAAFSPNSRYLYIPSFTKLYQFDTEAADLAASMVVVGEWDGFADPFATTFYMATLGPDGKIYINANNSAFYLHVINQPDNAGLACDFQQHALKLPTYVQFGMPHFPNYRLGALEGSPCDSLAVEVSEEANSVDCKMAGTVFPNPIANHSLTLNHCIKRGEKATFCLFNTTGRLVQKMNLEEGKEQHEVPIRDWANGLYFYQVWENNQLVYSGKVVVQR